MYELLEETLAFGFSLAFGFLVGVLIGLMLMQAGALVWMFWDMFIRRI